MLNTNPSTRTRSSSFPSLYHNPLYKPLSQQLLYQPNLGVPTHPWRPHHQPSMVRPGWRRAPRTRQQQEDYVDASLRLLLLASECVGEVNAEDKERDSRRLPYSNSGDEVTEDEEELDETDRSEGEDDDEGDGERKGEHDGDEEDANESRASSPPSSSTSSRGSPAPGSPPRQWDRRFRGVQKVRDGQYKAVIWRSRKKRNVVLGVYSDPVTAAKAYDKV